MRKILWIVGGVYAAGVAGSYALATMRAREANPDAAILRGDRLYEAAWWPVRLVSPRAENVQTGTAARHTNAGVRNIRGQVA